MSVEQPLASYNYSTNVGLGVFRFGTIQSIVIIFSWVAAMIIAGIINIMVSVILFIISSIILLIFLSRGKKILLYNSYFLIGMKIVFYRNILGIYIDGSIGLVRISFRDQEADILIERKSFPTNARKTHKIVANQQRKFEKICDKIVQRTKKLQPNLVLEVEDCKAVSSKYL